MPKTISIFSIPITALSLLEAQHTVDRYLAEQRFHHIVTVNPEMLLYASKHPAYAAIVQGASLRTIDGAGIIVVSRLLGHKLSFNDRAPGVDVASYLLERAEAAALRVLIVLPAKTYSTEDQISRALRARHPKLFFSLVQEGRDDTENTLEKFNPNIVFTAHGVPAQEEWIAQNRARLGSVSIAMGVGGTFDFLSGTIQRAPGFIRFLGLEWLFRLVREPKRLPRIIRATVLFPLKALLHR